MEVEELLYVDIDCGGIIEALYFLEGKEVDVVCGVDGLSRAEDVVGDGDTAAENGVVFDIVDSGEWYVRIDQRW